MVVKEITLGKGEQLVIRDDTEGLVLLSMASYDSIRSFVRKVTALEGGEYLSAAVVLEARDLLKTLP